MSVPRRSWTATSPDGTFGMDLQQGRWTAQLDGDFVIFLIGAMVHDPAVATEASQLFMAMGDMLDELEADPSKGLLGYTRHGEPGKGVSCSTGGRSMRSRPTRATPALGTLPCGARGTGLVPKSG